MTVPLPLLGLSLTSGSPLKMDLGCIFGNAEGTRPPKRLYLHNHRFSANIIDDHIPNESRLEPGVWGTSASLTVVEASKQCGRNRWLEVGPLTPLAEFLRGGPPTAVRWLADPTGSPLSHTSTTASICSLAIGPEGGWTTTELDTARAAGWQVVSLGPRILRIETAALVLSFADCLRFHTCLVVGQPDSPGPPVRRKRLDAFRPNQEIHGILIICIIATTDKLCSADEIAAQVGTRQPPARSCSGSQFVYRE